MNWALPRFAYGEHVRLLPVDGVKARVIDCHFVAVTGKVEYDVRYFDGGREFKVRVFEDELEAC